MNEKRRPHQLKEKQYHTITPQKVSVQNIDSASTKPLKKNNTEIQMRQYSYELSTIKDES